MALTVLTSLAGCREEAPAVEPRAGFTLEGSIAESGTVSHPCRLEEGQYLEILVHQSALDVKVEVLGIDGESLYFVDGPTARSEPELVAFVAPAAGTYQIEVEPSNSTEGGRYGIKVTASGPANEHDQKRAGAARLMTQGFEARYTDQQQARRFFEEAAAAWQELGDGLRQGKALFYIGLTSEALGEEELAFEQYGAALPWLRGSGDVRIEAEALHRRGSLLIDRERDSEARQVLEEAFLRRREAQDPVGQATTLQLLGQILAATSEHQALSLYEQALATLRDYALSSPEAARLTAVHEATTLMFKGQVYMGLGKAEAARHCFQQAQERLKDPGTDPWYLTTALNFEGQALFDLGQYAEAESVLRKALKRRQVTGDQARERPSFDEAITLNDLGLALQGLRRFEEAEGLFRQALSVFENEEPHAAATTVRNLGRLCLEVRRLPEAEQFLDDALQRYRSLEDEQGQAAVLRIQSRLRRAQEDFSAAEELSKAAIELFERLRTAVLPSPSGVQLESRAESLAPLEPYYSEYVDLLMERHRREPGQGYDARALAVSERSRARSLLSSLLEAGVPQHYLEAYRSLRGELAYAERTLRDSLAASTSPEAIGDNRERVEDLRRNLKKLEKEIRATSPKFDNLLVPQTLTAREIQQQVLDPETALLEFKLGKDRSFAWYVTDRSLDSFELPPHEEIEAVVRDIQELLASPGLTNKKKTEWKLQDLSDQILQPVASHLGKRHRLLIVSEGALDYVPFSALPIPGRPKDPLLVEHEIVHLPSASALAAQRRLGPQARAPGALAVVASPVYRPDDRRLPPDPKAVRTAEETTPSDLPYSRDEAESILALTEGLDTLKALDFRANKTTLIREVLGRYRIVHLATHAQIDSTQPALSRLLLSSYDEAGRRIDGELYTAEIYGLKLPAELVVLSACRTALGAEIAGEGLVGFTQAFLYAGAERALVSLWPIEDRPTAALMEHFYRFLLQKRLPPPEALRRAQLEMRQTKGWESPFFWSGFILQGEWRGSLLQH